MGTIECTVRELDYPEWVNKAYEDMHPAVKEDLVKAMIYSQIQPVPPEGFKISQLLRDGANRVEILDDIEHCLWALDCTLTFMAWRVMGDRKEIKFKQDNSESVEKEPRPGT